MAPISKILTGEQRERIVALWFIYGNDGPHHSMSNHKWIQQLIEPSTPRDLRDFYKPGSACIEVVEDVVFRNCSCRPLDVGGGIVFRASADDCELHGFGEGN